MAEMYVGLTGQSYTGADTPFGELLARVVKLAGSGAAAARAIGVSPTTLYRWRSGRQQPKTGSGVLARLIRRMSLKPSLEADIRAKRRTTRIVGWVVISRDSRRRKLDVGRHIPARKIGNVLTAWLNADDERADRLLWTAIDKHYVEDVQFDSIEAVTFVGADDL